MVKHKRDLGSLKYFSYSSRGIRLKNKQEVLNAISEVYPVIRKDKVLGEVAIYDYNSNSFSTRAICSKCKCVMWQVQKGQADLCYNCEVENNDKKNK